MDYPPQLQMSFGHFDLDPCAADNMPYRTADRMVTKDEDGLSVDWGNSRVWLNPPYGKEISKFLERMHNGVALLPSRTDNRWFHEFVAPRACCILFPRGRIAFINKNGDVIGTPAFASMIVGYTEYDAEMICMSGIKGCLMERMKDLKNEY